MSAESDFTLNYCTDIETLFVKYLPLLQKYSMVRGRFDEDLYGELTVAFMQCTKKFKLNTADFTDAFFYCNQQQKIRKTKGDY